MRRWIYVLAALLLFSQVCYAQTTITLKSGKTVEGTLLERNDKSVKIDFAGVPITYWMDEIESIRLEDGTILTPTPELKQEATPLLPQPAQSEPFASTPSFSGPSKTPLLDQEGFSYQDSDNSRDSKAASAAANRFFPFGIAFVIGILVMGLAVYIFLAFCLQRIAQKTSTPDEWFAWVPIMNLILLCDIARKPRWWAALFILGVIPYIGVIATAIVNVLIMMKICERMNRPAWWAFITIIPLVSFIIFALLAFGSETEENLVPYVPGTGAAGGAPAQNPSSSEPLRHDSYEQNQ